MWRASKRHDSLGRTKLTSYTPYGDKSLKGLSVLQKTSSFFLLTEFTAAAAVHCCDDFHVTVSNTSRQFSDTFYHLNASFLGYLFPERKALCHHSDDSRK